MSDARRGLHIASLDGVRALSFLVVFIGHALPTPLTRFVPPRFGVTVFFFLSGYLITTLMRVELDTNGHLGFRDFYLRRALRILPPFYFSFALALAMCGWGVIGGHPTPSAIAAYALQFANYWEIRHGLVAVPEGASVFWSLAVEEHFYLLFPLLYVLLRRCLPRASHQLAALGVLCASVLAWRFYLLARVASPLHLMQATDCRIDSILFGCALAVKENPALDATRLRERTWKLLLIPALGLLLATSLLRGPMMNLGARTTLQGLALIPMFAVAVRYQRWAPCRWLAWPWLTLLGRLSYSAYLVHYCVLKALAKHAELSWTLRLSVGLAFTLVIAYAIYLTIERPCARLRQQLHERAPRLPEVICTTSESSGARIGDPPVQC